MSKEILTHYIFLDTSIFIKENFFAGNKLKAFFKHEEESNINLLTTSIIRNECLSNLEKYLNDSNTILNKALKELNNKAKVLKNIEALQALFNLRNTFKLEDETKNLKEDLNNIFDSHFEEIEIDPEKTLKIIDDYFNENAPFKNGIKKNEFPDAIVLNSLESWCKANKTKVYVVSQDEDLNSFESEYLIPVKEYDKLLDQISFTFSDANFNLKVEDVIQESDKEIIDAIKESFIDFFPTSGVDDYSWIEFDIDSIEQIEITLLGHSILSIYDNVAEIEITVDTDYLLKISYEDADTGWYDKETGHYFGRELIHRALERCCELKAIFE